MPANRRNCTSIPSLSGDTLSCKYASTDSAMCSASCMVPSRFHLTILTKFTSEPYGRALRRTTGANRSSDLLSFASDATGLNNDGTGRRGGGADDEEEAEFDG